MRTNEEPRTSERQRISSGGPWEDRIGYPRAVRVDDHVWVSGTTGTHPDGTSAQTRLALATSETALREAGATPDEAVRVHIFVADIEEWQAVGVLLNEHFGHAKPAMTTVEVTRLIDPKHYI